MRRRGFLATCGAGALAGLAGCVDSMDAIPGVGEPLDVTGEWPRPEYDPAVTGQNPDVSGPEGEPEIRWEAETPVDSTHSMHLPAVVVADETVFVAGGSVVTALDLADGSELWQTGVAEKRLAGSSRDDYCSAAVDDEYVYVGTHEGLVALTRDGEVAWSHDVEAEAGHSGVFRSPAVTDDAVYFCTAEGQTVYAYTPDGDRLWAHELETSIIGGAAVADDTVFVSDSGKGLYAITTDGERLWTNETGGGAGTGVTPTVYDGTVFAVGRADSDGGRAFFAAYDAETGDEIWANNLSGSFVGSPAVLDWETTPQLAVPAWHGTVFTYSLEDGRLLWGGAHSEGVASMMGNPATDGESVYVAGADHVSKFSPWRDRDWRLSIDGAAGSVALLDGAMIVGSRDGYCYALA